MEQVSKKILIFVLWFRKRLRHRGELLGFDRLRIWKIQRVRAKRLKVVPPAVAYILPTPSWSRLTYIPAGVSRFFILTYTGIPEPSD